MGFSGSITPSLHHSNTPFCCNESHPMHKKITRRAFCSMLLALPFPAQAQQSKTVPRIGYLSNGDVATDTRSKGIRLALRERGYIEAQNIATEYRYAGGEARSVP
jgi:hypothetical protein